MDWFSNKGQVIGVGLQFVSFVWGPSLLAAATAITQQVRAVPLDWWVLGTVFIGSLILFVYTNRKRGENSFPQSANASSDKSWGRTVVTVCVSLVIGCGLGYSLTKFNEDRPLLTSYGEFPAGESLVTFSERQQAPSESERARQEQEKEKRQSSLSMMEEKRLKEDFLSLPRPCQFKVTAPRVHMPFRMGLMNAIRESYIQQFGSFEEIRRPDGGKPFTVAPCGIVEDDKDIRPERYPDQITYAPQGIVIVNGTPSHQATVDFLVKAFETRLGWTVRAGRDLPPDSPEELIYIQIGTGVLRN